MLLDAEAIKELGPWDESFLLYSEETEYALRAADRGWSLWYEPEAVIEHVGGESGTNPMLAALLIVNKVRLFRRRRGGSPRFAYYLSIVLGQSVRALAGSRTARAALAALLRPSHAGSRSYHSEDQRLRSRLRRLRVGGLPGGAATRSSASTSTRSRST